MCHTLMGCAGGTFGLKLKSRQPDISSLRRMASETLVEVNDLNFSYGERPLLS